MKGKQAQDQGYTMSVSETSYLSMQNAIKAKTQDDP